MIYFVRIVKRKFQHRRKPPFFRLSDSVFRFVFRTFSDSCLFSHPHPISTITHIYIQPTQHPHTRHIHTGTPAHIYKLTNYFNFSTYNALAQIRPQTHTNTSHTTNHTTNRPTTRTRATIPPLHTTRTPDRLSLFAYTGHHAHTNARARGTGGVR